MRTLALRLTLALAVVAAVASTASAQYPNVGPNDSFAWDIAAPDLATARGYVYKYYLDGATQGSLFANVTCSGTTAPFTCQAKSPTFSNGSHTLTITASSSLGESAQSVPFGFVFGYPPSVPSNIRVVKGTSP